MFPITCSISAEQRLMEAAESSGLDVLGIPSTDTAHVSRLMELGLLINRSGRLVPTRLSSGPQDYAGESDTLAGRMSLDEECYAPNPVSQSEAIGR